MAPGTFLFVERWQDQAAIDFHFAQSYCYDFIRAVRKRSKATSPIERHHIAKTAQTT
ncbi:MAG: quinol monooxygenase YgiN [Candidatus Azotimanducaceae bacterium]|jgi:quinol monooxygenase YgiN